MKNDGATSRSRILILEDEAPIRTALARYLEQVGYAVETAENGRIGLEKLRAEHFDLAVSDIMMPEMGGLAFLEKAKSERPDLDVVMVTGYGDASIAVEAMKNGAADFVTKPFQFDYLESIVRRLMERREDRADRPRDANVEHLEDRLHEKVRELSTLYSINESLDEVEGVEPVFSRMARLAAQSCDARSASAYIWEADTRTLVLHSVHPVGAASSRVPRVRASGAFVDLMRKPQDPRKFADPMGLAMLEPLLIAPERPPTSAVLAPLFVRGEAFGVLCVESKFGDSTFGEQDLGFVRTILKKAAVMIERAALYDTIQSNLVSTLTSLVRTLEAKDPYTRFHSDRVTNLAIMVGREMGVSQTDLEVLRFAGLLHDIGKIGVSDAILQKKGSLTPEEFEAIKAHPIIGDRILEPLGMLPEERSIIRHHHERWDGRGYPDGLAGKDIPFLARVLTLADSYDAMTSDRVYRLGLSHDVALGEVVRYAGRQFDPNVVAAFESLCRRHAHDLQGRMNAGIDKDSILTQRLRPAS